MSTTVNGERSISTPLSRVAENTGRLIWNIICFRPRLTTGLGLSSLQYLSLHPSFQLRRVPWTDGNFFRNLISTSMHTLPVVKSKADPTNRAQEKRSKCDSMHECWKLFSLPLNIALAGTFTMAVDIKAVQHYEACREERPAVERTAISPAMIVTSTLVDNSSPSFLPLPPPYQIISAPLARSDDDSGRC